MTSANMGINDNFKSTELTENQVKMLFAEVYNKVKSEDMKEFLNSVYDKIKVVDKNMPKEDTDGASGTNQLGSSKEKIKHYRFTYRDFVPTIHSECKRFSCECINCGEKLLLRIGEEACTKCFYAYNVKREIHSNEKDNINPAHYNSHPSGIECIAVSRHHSFNIGNVFKYCWRAGVKNKDTHLEDLKKAAWYLNDEIQKLEGEK